MVSTLKDDAVAHIKARLDIVEVVGAYLALHKSGREHKGLCPFHSEKTPSFTVSQDKQAWYCFGCQEGGDMLSFVEKIEHVDFRGALQQLADKAGVELEERGAVGTSPGRTGARRKTRALELHATAQLYFEHVLWKTPAGAPGRELLSARSVSESLARQFGVGFAPAGGMQGDALFRYLTTRCGATADEVADAGLAHASTRGGSPRDRFRARLLFPIRDERGRTIGFGGRALGDAIPKYLNSPETAIYHKSHALFGIDQAKAACGDHREAVLVEGYFDVIAAHAAGIHNVVASSGTALAREQVRLLARYVDSVVLCLDGDSAGRAATERVVDIVAAEGLKARICRMPADYKDPDAWVTQDPAGFASAITSALPEWQVLVDEAVGNAEGGSIDDRRAAAARAVAVLLRIPEATTQELYIQRAARRLDVSVDVLARDVEQGKRGVRREPSRVLLAAPEAAVDSAEGLNGPAEGHSLPVWEAYIGSLVVQRPLLARRLTEEMGLDISDLRSPATIRFVEVALGCEPTEAFPLHVIEGAYQRVAAQLLLRTIPELDDIAPPEALDVAMADCIRLVREAAVHDSLATIRQKLRRATDEGRIDDAQGFATELENVAKQTPLLRRSRSTS